VLRVLDAACGLFAQQGVRATTLDQVGRSPAPDAASCTCSSPARPTSSATVVALQVDRVLAAQQPLLDAMADADGVRDWCVAAAGQYGPDDAIRCPVGSLVHELSGPGSDAASRAAVADGFERWRAALAAGLHRAAAHGGLAPGTDPDAAAAALLAAYQGGVLLAAATGRRERIAQALAAVADGLCAPAQRRPTDGGA
jgi:AcrR family transcriptional regulator